MATAIFAPQTDSHPFEQRTISLKERVKIGRVVKTAPSNSQNDLLFECKVLSRNHALIWYEDKKFYIQDTKSSNGTFVNSVCLSRGAERSDPVEIKSGDIIQFGVTVTDSSKTGGNEKVSHNCIIAAVTLFHPDGKQADGFKEDHWAQLVNSELKAQEIWQLSQSLQDALHREQMLENKLATLQRLIDNSVSATDDTWQGLIEEEKLLTRLNALESQLEVVTKELAEEDVRLRIVGLLKDKETYELKAKEMLEESIKDQESLKVKLTDVERSLGNSEDECTEIKTLYEKSRSEFEDLLVNFKQNSDDMNALQKQAAEAETKHTEALSKASEQVEMLRMELKMAEKRGSSLAVEVESLQAECDFMQNQLAAMKERLEQQQEAQLDVTEADSLENESEVTALQRKNSELLSKLSMLEEQYEEKTTVSPRISDALEAGPVSDFISADKDSKWQDIDFVEGLQNLQDTVLDINRMLSRSVGASDSATDVALTDDSDDKHAEGGKSNGGVVANGQDHEHGFVICGLIETCQQNLISLKDRVARTDDQNREICENKRRLEDELAASQVDKEQLQDSVAALQTLLGGEEMKMESLEATVLQLKAEADEVAAKAREEADKRIEELRQRVAAQESSSQARIGNENEAELLSAKEEVEKLSLKVEGLEDTLKRVKLDNVMLVKEKGIVSNEKAILSKECERLKQRNVEVSDIDRESPTNSIRNRKLHEPSLPQESAGKTTTTPTCATNSERTTQSNVNAEIEQQQQQQHLLPLSNSQWVNFLVAVVFIAVLFLTLLLMDIVRIVPGNSPLFSANAWNEAWHTIF